VWENGKLRRLGTLGGKESDAVAINDRGKIVGQSPTKGSTWPEHGFLWEDGKMTDLGPDNWPLAINNRGEIIFWWGRTGSVWRNGRFVTLGTLGGKWKDAVAINDGGQVVGRSSAKVARGTQGHAFVSENGVMTDLGTLDGGKASGAVAINNKGQIVGNSDTGEPGRGGYYDPPSHAVLWTLRSG